MEIIPHPDMDLDGPIEVHLFGGCCLEAQRSDTVALQLEGLRFALGKEENSDVHLATIVDTIRACARLLRELADLSQIHQERIRIVLNHLNVILPCLSRTLRDITTYYEDRALTKTNRWRTMYHKMAEEAEGMTLPHRFKLYNYFLKSLRDVLIRSPDFDFNGLEEARIKIMHLREHRGIPPPPVPVGPWLRSAALAVDGDPRAHWAENIFSLPLSSRTAMKHQHQSMSIGPHQQWGQLPVPEGSKILFRRPFNDDQISVIAYENGLDRSPYLLIRLINTEGGGAWFSMRGFHELCIEREGSSLILKRWSRTAHTSKNWAILNFKTWEELVLLSCTFLALKARNDLTVGMGPNEYSLRGEKKLFQAKISDDGFWHHLIVFQDQMTGGVRLQASVLEGQLRLCPVWTAFVTRQASSTNWMKRASRKRVRLSEIQPYVFCQNYKHKNQRRGQSGAFEIAFLNEGACQHFRDLFRDLFPSSRPRSRTPEAIAAGPDAEG